MRALLATVGVCAVITAACGGGGGSATNPDARASYATLVGAGSKLMLQGNVNAAQQLFEKAIAKDPHSPVAYYDLGVVYEHDGDTRDAIGNYFHAIAENRDYVPALYNQAGLLAKNNAPLATFYYRRIIDLKPDSPTAFLNLGLLELKTKALHVQAFRALGQAVKLDPSLRAQLPAPLRSQLPKR